MHNIHQCVAIRLSFWHSLTQLNSTAGEMEEEMDLMSLLIFLAIGAVAGWLAGVAMKGGGFGLLGDIVIGIIGAVIGGWLFGFLGITTGGIVGAIITAFVGACLLLFVIRLIKKA